MIIHVAPQASIATTPNPSPSVANEVFAPLGGAAATPVAALKTPVAPEEGNTQGVRCCSGRHRGLPLRLDARIPPLNRRSSTEAVLSRKAWSTN